MLVEYEPHPKNGPGHFYATRGLCFVCDATRREAPDLIAVDDCEGCHFVRQPETLDEIGRAINAVRVSCADCLRYGGNDPAILDELCGSGMAKVCDILKSASSADAPRDTKTPARVSDRSHPLWDRDLDP
jgi:hypothetical protein